MPLEISIEGRLPVHGSRELLGQAVANLLDNAMKHGGDGRVTITAARTRDVVAITVADRGPGIAEVDRGRVLERFVRLESARSRPGFGLGLSLAAAVARLHGGALRLEDNAPGLRAVIEVPALISPDAMPALPPAEPEAAARAIAPAGRS